jgi:hypothetical protein
MKRKWASWATVAVLGTLGALMARAARVPDDVAQANDAADPMRTLEETDRKAPVDYGAGPGIKLQAKLRSDSGLRFPASAAARLAVPSGSSTANVTGVFGAAVTWPLIPIHVVLLPDSRVMSYGTDATGAQGAQFIYDVWDPSLGTDSNAHLVLPNSTTTDIFCGAQTLMLSGEVLTSGGDLIVNGARNSANNQTTIFSPSANTLTPNTAMTYARWYATLLALPNGQVAVFGGRQNVGTPTPVIPATTPELYDPALRTWSLLSGATSNAAFGANWWYPRVYVAPGGKVFVLNTKNGKMFYLSSANGGSITSSIVVAPAGNIAYPSAPFAPGKLLSIRANRQVVVIDYSTPTPVVTATDPIDQNRFWASATVLADGRVLVSGGSGVDNVLTGVDYRTQLWDPNTGHWTAGAAATKARLYHSTAMLLPDATVLTAGGGAPGPVTNLNAEIYYPPYLYAADGTAAARPTLNATNLPVYDPGATVTATVGPADAIARLTLVRSGSETHSNDADSRFLSLSFTQTGTTLAATLPSDGTVLVPGYYMLFAINTAGVPSIARVFLVTSGSAAPANFSLSPSSLAIGTVMIGTSSAAQSFMLTNGGGALPLSSISFTGAGAKQYKQTNNCPGVIPASSSCIISVVFTPTAAGTAKATLNVSASGVAQTAVITGVGSEPFTVTPTAVSFGKVTVGASSASQPVTVMNIGTAALPINSITFNGAAPTQFSQTNNCGSSVPAGSGCTINVVFSPAVVGPNIWAKLNVASPGGTHSSRVSGSGT